MYNFNARAIPVRRGPPRLLGPDAQGFAYSATTPQNQTHESGLQLRVKLSTSHPNIPFKTGELIEGTIIISKPDALPSSTTGSEEAVRVRSLTLRAYFESRTLFWHFQLASDKARAKYAPSVSQDHELTIGHEIHRGPVPQEDIEFSWEEGRSMVLYLDEVGADGKTPEVSLPFAFRLPERVRVNECNEYPDAPRDLCTVLRSPPPSFPNSPVASVQWVAEAILRLNTPSPSSSEPLVDVVDERLFRQSTPTTLVSRVVFPVLPSDAHTQELTKVPYFGRDLNEDPFGAMITWEGQADELDRLRERGYIGEWRTWTKFTRLNSRKLVSAEVTLIAELSVQKPTTIQRSKSSIPLILALRLSAPVEKGSKILSKKSLKEISITRSILSLKRHVLTRGGKTIVPHTDIETVRSEAVYPNGSGGGDEGGKKKEGPCLKVPATETPVIWELSFDLQSDSFMGGRKDTDRRNTRANTLMPSFRTPNIQLEYTISVTISVDNHGEYFVTSFPIQLLTGDSLDLPSFYEATETNVNGARPSVNTDADADGVLPPAYVV